MTQTPGWYDDPQDPTQLRYWDGVVWSSHVTPKVSPTVEQSHIGMPYAVTPAAARPEGSGSHGAQGTPFGSGGFDQPPQDQGQRQQGQWPAYGQAPEQFAQQQPGWRPPPATTPDGVELAGWWLRAGARLLDGLFTGLLSFPFAAWFIFRYLVELVRWMEDVMPSTTEESVPIMPVMPLPPWEVLKFALAAGFIQLLIASVYEVFFLTRSGATPGKKIAGISVRLRDRAGPPPMKTVLGRTACYYGFQVLSPANVLDVLWPLWDDKKQALHDKVVGTNVVVGPQPRRDA